MKISGVKSLMEGQGVVEECVQEEEIEIETVMIDDDGVEVTNESGRVTVDSVDSSYYTDQKSSDDLEEDSPCSPAVDTMPPALPLFIYYDDPQNEGSSVNEDTGGSKDVQNTYEELHISANGVPSSPDVVCLSDSPESPAVNTAPDSGSTMKVRFEVSDTNAVSFCLDNVGGKDAGPSAVEDSVNAAGMSTVPSTSTLGFVPASDVVSDPDRTSEVVLINTSNENEFPPMYTVDDVDILDNCNGRKLSDQLRELEQSSSQDPGEGTSARPLPKRTCFNCEGDHVLNQCPQKLNQKQIKKKRQQYKSQMRDRDNRYFVQTLDQKYSHFQPGKISKGLKSALGLMPDEIPHHVYNMRKHGYPPGHFDETLNSLESTFGPCGSNTVRTTMEGSLKWLSQNLPDYPGFTSPVPDGCRDNGTRLGKQIDPFAKDRVVSAMDHVYNQPSVPSSSRTNDIAKMLQDLEHISLPDASTAKETANKPNWFDDLYDSSPPATSSFHNPNSDVAEVEQIFEKVVMRKPTGDGDWSDRVYEGHKGEPRNYRMTEEYEREDQERKNMLAKKKKAEEELRAREREREYRSASPSLLNPDTPIKFMTTFPSNDAQLATNEAGDDEIVIVENEPGSTGLNSAKPASSLNFETGPENYLVGCKDSNIMTISQKRPLDSDNGIIVLSSDEEEEEEGDLNEKKEEIAGPSRKKPKLTDYEKCDLKRKYEATSSAGPQPKKLKFDDDDDDDSDEDEDIDKKPNMVPNPVHFMLMRRRLSAGTQKKNLMPSATSDLPPVENVATQKNDLFTSTTSDLPPIENFATQISNLIPSTISDLPPIENFAKGISELQLTAESQNSGRFDAVRNVLQKKRIQMKDTPVSNEKKSESNASLEDSPEIIYETKGIEVVKVLKRENSMITPSKANFVGEKNDSRKYEEDSDDDIQIIE